MDRIHDIDSLLKTGIDLMVASGYHNTSINEVIRVAGLPKGSFYYLYKDKKAFALEAISRYAQDLGNGMDRVFSNADLTPLEAIRRYYLGSIQSLHEAGFSHGCFLGNMGQEMSDVDEDFRRVIELGFALIHEKLSVQLVKAPALRRACYQRRHRSNCRPYHQYMAWFTHSHEDHAEPQITGYFCE